ncbi:LysR family transcriptional regulator [Xanthobacter sp. TB0139]|uniref:LysR family transcriptional regulator n=1 Tax=Xanthobacter sp. TB0139 TaxID=3459178 RepID=UPI00403991E4
MSRSRRFLPSVSLLNAFEAVLRTGSTAAAARELDLSQGAVSRLVQNLESQLGCVLFLRQRQRLVPTAAAQAYGRDISRALDLIQRASMELVANPGGGTLSLAILPALGTRWLAPRLGRFAERNPGISINLATRLRRFNFEVEGFDAAIHFGAADWRDAGHMKLFDERLTACIAPDLLRVHPVECVADMEGLALLQLETRTSAWATWFRAQGAWQSAGQGGGRTGARPARGGARGGMLFDQFAPMIQAAIAGLGVALLPEYLARPELEAGRLVPVLGGSVEGTGAYWLVWPVARADYPPLEIFRRWLAQEVDSAGSGPDMRDHPIGNIAGPGCAL